MFRSTRSRPALPIASVACAVLLGAMAPVSITDEIRQVAINLRDRIHKLEVQQQVQPVTFDYRPYQDTIQLTTTADTPVAGAEAVLEPGYYLVEGHFDIEAGTSGGGLTDEAFLAVGQLLSNGTPMPGTAIMKLLSVLGSDAATRRGMRAVVSHTWILSIFDYSQAVLQDNASLYYPLDDNALQLSTYLAFARDISRNDFSGSRVGTTRLLPGPLKPELDGSVSYASQFNGTTDRITNVSLTHATDKGTAECWCKTTAAAVQVLMGSGNVTTHRNGLALYLDATGHVVIETNSAAASDNAVTATAYNDGNWHHVMGTFDGTIYAIYVDGVVQTTKAQTVVPVAATLTVGADGTPANFFNGYMAAPAYYSGIALRPSRALYHYQLGVSTYLPSDSTYVVQVLADVPSRYFRMDEVSGTVMADLSANNQSGTYSGVTLNQPGALMAESDGTYNPSAKFEGSTSVATAPDTGLPTGNANRTAEAWIYLTATPATVPPVRATIFGYGTPSVADQAWYLSVIASRVLRFSNDTGTIDGTTVLQLRRWYHVAVQSVGNNITVFLDGDIEASGTLTLNTVLSGTFYIGNFSVANRAFIGAIDDVSLTASSLSATRIATRYRYGRSNRAFITLAVYKTGGTDISAIKTAGTKMVVTRLLKSAKS